MGTLLQIFRCQCVCLCLFRKTNGRLSYQHVLNPSLPLPFPQNQRAFELSARFEPVLAFALRSSLTFSEMDTWMLDDEIFCNSVKVALVSD